MYHAKIDSIMAPSILLKESASPILNIVMFIPSTIRRMVTAIFSGMSLLRLFLVITRGEIRAVTPRIMSVLKRFEPTMLPTAISDFPWNEERKLTTISGAEVPMPTIVRPITNSLSPNFLAMLEAPSTR